MCCPVSTSSTPEGSRCCSDGSLQEYRHPQLRKTPLTDGSPAGKQNNCVLAFKRQDARAGKVK